MLWELSVVEQRYTAIQEVLGGMPVTEVADRYGVSRQSVHAWLRRYQAGGLAGLEDRSHRPRSCPHQASVQVEAAVCERVTRAFLDGECPSAVVRDLHRPVLRPGPHPQGPGPPRAALPPVPAGRPLPAWQPGRLLAPP